jgi:hypothetical protein
MDAQGQLTPARAILDSGSQLNLISSKLANTLALKKTKMNHNLTGIDGKGFQVNHLVHATIMDNQNLQSQEEQECEEHFTQNYYRDEEGKYVVKIPMIKNGAEALGDSLYMAKKRLESLLKRFESQPQFKIEYEKFLKEYEDLGHMTQVEFSSINKPWYFLPHHAVFKMDSSTTKLRVVFDAAAKTSTGKSLNDVMLCGPTIQQDLIAIMMRFRLHKYVLTGDIEKMYRQIKINAEDQNLQLILWKEGNQYICYRLNTVTYGTKAAPFLATRAMKQLFLDEADEVTAKIWKDTYVDDILTGSSSLEELKQMQLSLCELFKKGGMKIRKWATNAPSILEDVPAEDLEMQLGENVNQTIKALGIQWCPIEDFIKYKVNFKPLKKITKRTTVSSIATIYDPLGLLSAVLIKAKIFMQSLWLHKIDWDETLPPQLQEKWINLTQELPELENIPIKRYVSQENYSRIELHGFADSSETAYSAVLYIRTISNEKITSEILCTKTRVAPLKKVTIPRLELCAAQLLTNLTKIAIDSLNIKFDSVILWSDSEIVLTWLKTPSHQLKTFVANRVANIQELTQDFIWKHVRSNENPADLNSRGISVEELKASKLWWHGASKKRRRMAHTTYSKG